MRNLLRPLLIQIILLCDRNRRSSYPKNLNLETIDFIDQVEFVIKSCENKLQHLNSFMNCRFHLQSTYTFTLNK